MRVLSLSAFFLMHGSVNAINLGDFDHYNNAPAPENKNKATSTAASGAKNQKASGGTKELVKLGWADFNFGDSKAVETEDESTDEKEAMEMVNEFLNETMGIMGNMTNATMDDEGIDTAVERQADGEEKEANSPVTTDDDDDDDDGVEVEGDLEFFFNATNTTTSVSESQCALCELGDTGFNADRLVLGPDGEVVTCLTLDTMISRRRSTDCNYDGTISGVDVQALCDCPVAGYPDVCAGICPDGEDVADPNFVVKGLTCEQWNDHALASTSKQVCDSLSETAMKSCCSKSDTPEPTEEPEDVKEKETQEPTTAAPETEEPTPAPKEETDAPTAAPTVEKAPEETTEAPETPEAPENNLDSEPQRIVNNGLIKGLRGNN